MTLNGPNTPTLCFPCHLLVYFIFFLWISPRSNVLLTTIHTPNFLSLPFSKPKTKNSVTNNFLTTPCLTHHQGKLSTLQTMLLQIDNLNEITVLSLHKNKLITRTRLWHTGKESKSCNWWPHFGLNVEILKFFILGWRKSARATLWEASPFLFHRRTEESKAYSPIWQILRAAIHLWSRRRIWTQI